jgi:AraC-like DNA-binding protein
MLNIAGLSISIFLGVILLTKKKKSTPDLILAGWLLTIGFHLFLHTLFITGKYVNYPHLLGLEKPVTILHGIFLYLYTLSLTAPRRIGPKSLLHFIPTMVVVLAMGPFLLMSGEEKRFIYQNNGVGYETFSLVVFIITLLSGFIYCALSFRSLYKHKKRLADNFSYTEKINLNWLLYLIISILVIWIAVIWGDDEIIFSLSAMYVLFLGYYGIKQVGIFTNTEVYMANKTWALEPVVPYQPHLPEQPEVVKYAHSQLTEVQLKEIHTTLTTLMQQKKSFIIPELTLSMTAEMLDVHPNILSEVINRVEKKNFFDYINTLRVDEFKVKIKQPENQHFTLLALALECGFNSKTSFNRNFKSLTGKTPTQYLQENNLTHP